MDRPNRQIDLYRQTAVASASPLQLVIMLYDGALKHMANGRKAMAEGDTFRQNKALQSAQRVIAELISCLDMEKGAEISQNLLALYTFCYNRLVEANVADSEELVEQAEEVMRNLRSGWAELEQSLKSSAVPRDAAA